jgi:hypothetical protein
MEALKVIGPVTWCRLNYRGCLIEVFGDWHCKAPIEVNDDDEVGKQTIVTYLGSKLASGQLLLETGNGQLKDCWLTDTLHTFRNFKRVDLYHPRQDLYQLTAYYDLAMTLFTCKTCIQVKDILTRFMWLAKMLLISPNCFFDHYVNGYGSVLLGKYPTPLAPRLAACKTSPEDKKKILERYHRQSQRTVQTLLRVTELVCKHVKSIGTVSKQDLDVIATQLARAYINVINVYSHFSLIIAILQAGPQLTVYVGDAHAVECLDVLLLELGARCMGRHFNTDVQEVNVR